MAKFAPLELRQSWRNCKAASKKVGSKLNGTPYAYLSLNVSRRIRQVQTPYAAQEHLKSLLYFRHSTTPSWQKCNRHILWLLSISLWVREDLYHRIRTRWFKSLDLCWEHCWVCTYSSKWLGRCTTTTVASRSHQSWSCARPGWGSYAYPICHGRRSRFALLYLQWTDHGRSEGLSSSNL